MKDLECVIIPLGQCTRMVDALGYSINTAEEREAGNISLAIFLFIKP